MIKDMTIICSTLVLGVIGSMLVIKVSEIVYEVFLAIKSRRK